MSGLPEQKAQSERATRSELTSCSEESEEVEHSFTQGYVIYGIRILSRIMFYYANHVTHKSRILL